MRDAGHTEAEGYAASLRQQAEWIEKSRAGEMDSNDIDVAEILAAADFIERSVSAQHKLDPATVQACAKLVEQQQETIRETSDGSERYLAPRKVGNQMGLAYVTGIMALALSSRSPALESLIREYARDLRRNSSGGDDNDYPWEWAKATADYLEILIERASALPSTDRAPATWQLRFPIEGGWSEWQNVVEHWDGSRNPAWQYRPVYPAAVSSHERGGVDG